MKAQYVAIGSEVLRGTTVNTNSHFISKNLEELGFSLQRHLAIHDDAQALKNTIQEALDEFDLSIFSGGLGPTCDDLTKQIASQAIGYPIVKSEIVHRFLKEKFPNLKTIEEQSNQIQNAHLFENRIGTAFGFALEKKGKIAIFLPGVPREMQEMFLSGVALFLKEKFEVEKKFSQRFLVLLKREHEVDPFLKQLILKDPSLSIGIYPNYGFLEVHFASTLNSSLIEAVNAFNAEFEQSIATESNLLPEALLKLLEEKKLKLSVAESCTGGKVSELLTSISGASNTYLGGVTAYSNESKINILEVDPHILQSEGAVSQACAIAMTLGVKKIFGSDISISTTGIAGPLGGSSQKPVGTVFLAISCQNQTFGFKLPTPSSNKREIIVSYTANYLLASLYRYLKFQIIP